MTLDKASLMAMLECESPTEAVQEAIALLSDSETEPVGSVPGYGAASLFFDMWRIRQWMVEQAGIPVWGLNQLLANLEQLDAGEQILLGGFRGQKKTGVFLARKEYIQLVGFVIVERRPDNSAKFRPDGTFAP